MRNQTGANVDVPANATERVAGNFGPGPARDVLSSLLNGSHFNYVLLGSASNADALERVILIVKSSTGEPSATPETASATAPAPAETAEATTEDQAPEQGEENLFAEEPGNQAETPAPAFGQPASPRTPEQMLQDMQRQQDMEQQIQQRQQQLGLPAGLQGPRGMPPGLPQPPQQPQ